MSPYGNSRHKITLIISESRIYNYFLSIEFPKYYDETVFTAYWPKRYIIPGDEVSTLIFDYHGSYLFCTQASESFRLNTPLNSFPLAEMQLFLSVRWILLEHTELALSQHPTFACFLLVLFGEAAI